MPNKKTASPKSIRSSHPAKVSSKKVNKAVASLRENRSLSGFKWNPLYTYLILGIVLVMLVILYSSMNSTKGSDPSIDSQLPSSQGVNINTPYK